jgi:epidermal growth factor receptor substrate 15
MRYIVLILLIFATSWTWSQNLVFEFKGQIDNLDANRREGGVNVSIVQGGSTVASATTASNGKYSLSSAVNYKLPFKIVFSKPGFVSKFVQFNLASLNEEDIPAGTTFKPLEDLSMSIFQDRDNVDFSFLNNESVATFDWNANSGGVRLNSVESAKISKKILDLLEKADKDKAEAEIKYQAAIAKADELYNSKSYEAALAKYEEALKYKPAEKYPADRVVELDALIQANKAKALAEVQKDEKYNNLITAADNLKVQGKLVEAVSKYQAAVTEKNAQYPKDQIIVLTKQIEDQKKEAENQAQYDAAIKAADGFFKQNSVRAARDKYIEASKLKPSEKYPKDKLAELDGKLAVQAEKEAVKQKYDDAIAVGDALFNEDKLVEAKSKYKEALLIETSSAYAKGRVEMIDAKLKEQQEAKAKEEQITKLLGEGGAFMVASKWDDAKGKFNAVLALDSENAEAKQKMAIIAQKIEEAKNLALQEENYTKLVKEGDAANTAKKYADAISKYEQAIQIKSTPETVGKIDAIKKIMADLASAGEKKAKYDEAIKSADELFKSSKWDESIAKYKEAIAIDNSLPYPTQKITEIEKLKAQANAKEQKKASYDAAVQAADNLFNTAKWDEAKAKYREALVIDNTQTYPTGRISEIDGILAGAAEEAKLKKKYEDIVAAANKLFSESDWDKAKVKYKEAIALDASQPLPAQKITEIEKIQADAKALADKKANYDKTILAADDLFTKKKYEDSKAKYQEAIGIDATQAYPNTRIAEIDKLMGNAAAEAERKAKYETAIRSGDQLFGSGTLVEAKAKYNEAIAIDGAQAYPKEKIVAIDKLIAGKEADAQKTEKYRLAVAAADNLFEQSKWPEAKVKYQEALSIIASEVYPVQKIAEIDSKIGTLAKIKGLLAEGKSLFNQNKLEPSLGKYQEVVAIDATNTEAKSQIAAINAKLLAMQSNAEKEANFEKLKTDGYSLADKKEYENAISKLEEALVIKGDAGITNKITELKAAVAAQNDKNNLDEKYAKLITEAGIKESSADYAGAIKSYDQALVLKPNEALPKTKIADLKALIGNSNAQKAIDEKYKAALKKGDDLMAQKKYLEAIKEFNNALTIKPEEREPVDKAAEAARLEKASETDGDQQYEKILTAAQGKIDNKEYVKAIELLNRALLLRPADTRPKELLDYIESLKKIDADYNALMTKGNDLAGSKSYEEAKSAYSSALSKKPNESLPVERINEMDRLILEAASSNQKDQLYSNYMSKGNVEFSKKEYVIALSQFQNALSVKPNDVPAMNKIKEVQQILDDIANSKADNVELLNQFNALLKIADAKFSNLDYLNAKTAYLVAQNVMTNSYIETQIKECDRLEREKGNIERQVEYQKIIDAGDKYFGLADYEKSKEYFSRAKNVRNDDPYPRKKLAEIERLLHPIVVDSEKLEDLGDPFDNSIMDGQSLLAKAESERKLIKKTKIQKQHNAIKDSETARTAAKTKSNYDQNNEIYMVFQKVQLDAGESDLNRQALIDALRASQLELQNMDRSNMDFESGENQTDQQALNFIVNQSALVYGEKESVYRENTDIMNNYNVLQANAVTEQNRSAYDGNLDSDQTLNTVRIQVAETTIEGNKLRENNTEVLKKSAKELSDATNDDYNRELEKYLANKGAINKEVNVNSGIDELAQLAHDDKVEYLKMIDKKTQVKDQSVHKGDLEQRQAAKQTIDNSYSSVEVQTNKELEKRDDNNDKLIDVNKTLQEKNAVDNIGQQDKYLNNYNVLQTNAVTEQNKSAYDGNLDSDQTLKTVRIQVAENMLEGNNLRENNAVVLKKSAKELSDATNGDYNRELQKYLANKGAINKEVNVNSGIDELAQLAHDDKVEYLKMVDKKTQDKDQSVHKGDLQQRQDAKQTIDNSYANVDIQTNKELEKRDDNNDKLIDVNKSLQAKNAADNIGQQDKHYDAMSELNKITDKPMEKARVANSLGEEYPEGVSEESFTQNDKDGLMKAIITRRIVVREGHADVYIRTQTLNGITYSKNGTPSLSHVWSSETQDPALKRNY